MTAHSINMFKHKLDPEKHGSLLVSEVRMILTQVSDHSQNIAPLTTGQARFFSDLHAKTTGQDDNSKVFFTKKQMEWLDMVLNEVENAPQKHQEPSKPESKVITTGMEYITRDELKIMLDKQNLEINATLEEFKKDIENLKKELEEFKKEIEQNIPLDMNRIIQIHKDVQNIFKILNEQIEKLQAA